MAKSRIALIAHDQMKDRMIEWAEKHRAQLVQCDIVSTGTTGGRIIERCPELQITRMKSDPLGSDQKIGALIAEGRIDGLVFFVDPLCALIAEGRVDGLVFFVDPLSPHPHDVDVKALPRLALVYNIPMAYNPSTAELVVAGYMATR